MSYAITQKLKETYDTVSSSVQENCKKYLVTPAQNKFTSLQNKHPRFVSNLPVFISTLAISYFTEKKVFCGVSLLLGVNLIKPAFITDDLMKKILLGGTIVVGSKTILTSVEAFAKFCLCAVLLGTSYNYTIVKEEIKGYFV